MKNIIFFLTIFVTTQVKAEGIEIKWSDKLQEKSDFFEFLGADNDHLFTIAKERDKNLINCYKKGTFTLEYSIQVDEKKRFGSDFVFQKAYVQESNLIVLVSGFYNNSKNAAAYVLILDKSTGKLKEEPRKIFDSAEGIGFFRFSESQNKKYLLIGFRSCDKKGGTWTYNWTHKLYNENFEEIATTQKAFSIKAKAVLYDLISSSIVDDSGNIFLMHNEIDPKDFMKQTDKRTVIYAYLKTENYEEVPIIYKDENEEFKYTSSIGMLSDGKNIHLYSIIMDKDESKGLGPREVLYAYIYNKVNLADIKSFDTKGKVKNYFMDLNNPPTTFRDHLKDKYLKLTHIILGANGMLYCVSECVYLNSFGSVVISKFDTEGKLVWTRYILKKQEFTNKDHSSCLVALDGETLCLIYNEDQYNFNDVSEDLIKVSSSIKDCTPAIFSIKKDGEIFKQKAEPLKPGTFLNIDKSTLHANGELLLFANSGSTEKIGFCRFK